MSNELHNSTQEEENGMNDIPVSFAVDEYLADKAPNLEPGSLERYQSKLHLFAAWCDEQGIFLAQIRNIIVHRFLEHLKKTHHSHKAGRGPLSSKTIFGYVRTIKTFLYWCLDDDSPFREGLSLLTVKNVRPPKVQTLIVEVFSDHQIEGMLTACKAEENEYMRTRATAVVSLLSSTGIRAAELCTLTIGNVRMSVGGGESYVLVLGKGQKWREVPFDKETRRKLSTYLIKHRRGALPEERVFLNRDRTAPFTVPALQQLVERLGNRAGITGQRVSPHVFRHTRAANWYMLEGKDIFEVGKLLGHSSVATTQHYLDSLSTRNMRQAVRVVKR